MTAFICFGQPPSANKSRKQGAKFLDAVRHSHTAAGTPKLDGLLYGIVYWFAVSYDPKRHPDADNISKPVWDALSGAAFLDDKQVRFRVAAVVDLGSASTSGGPNVGAVDLSTAPANVAGAVEELLSRRKAGGAVPPGFCYIEVGPLGPGMMRFGLATPAPGDPETAP